MKIRVAKSELKKIGNEFLSNADELRNEKQKLNVIFSEIKEHWQGDDCDKCVSTMKEVYIPNLEKICKKFESYGKYLKEVPTVYEEVDSNYRKKKIGR